jgi:hypothetical protein
VSESIEELRAIVEAWKETAAQHLRNEEFYRGIVRQIGEQIGIAARTSDDSSVQDDVLALKVPELVTLAIAKAKLDALELKMIECIFFGGPMPEGWNLEGLAGRIIRNKMEKDKADREKAEIGSLHFESHVVGDKVVIRTAMQIDMRGLDVLAQKICSQIKRGEAAMLNTDDGPVLFLPVNK